jgi:hypothetical protein
MQKNNIPNQRLARFNNCKTGCLSNFVSRSIHAVNFNHNDLLLQLRTLLVTLVEALLPRLLYLGRSHRLHASRCSRIRLLATPLATRLDVSPRRTAAAKTHLHQPRKDGECASDPHEDEKRRAYRRANVELFHLSDSVAEDDEHDGCDDGCDGDDEGVEEGEDGDGEREPACEDGDGHEEDEDEGEAGACKEETEHPAGDVLDEVENVVDVGGEIDYHRLLA